MKLGASRKTVQTTAIAMPAAASWLPRRAPLLVTAEMVRGMRRGGVIVDLAAETGGNVEVTRPGEVVHERARELVAAAS